MCSFDCIFTGGVAKTKHHINMRGKKWEWWGSGLREAHTEGTLSHFSPVEGEISQLADCLAGGWSRCVVSLASGRWRRTAEEMRNTRRNPVNYGVCFASTWAVNFTAQQSNDLLSPPNSDGKPINAERWVNILCKPFLCCRPTSSPLIRPP